MPSVRSKASLPAAKGIVRAASAPSRLMPRPRFRPAGRARRPRGVAKGVAEGVKAICSPRPAAWRINSIRSPRFSGSPPVNTTVGVARKGGRLIQQRLGQFGRKLVGVAASPGPRPGSACTPGRRPGSLRNRTSTDFGRNRRKYRQAGSLRVVRPWLGTGGNYS